jgi:hypothetical protein
MPLSDIVSGGINFGTRLRLSGQLDTPATLFSEVPPFSHGTIGRVGHRTRLYPGEEKDLSLLVI